MEKRQEGNNQTPENDNKTSLSTDDQTTNLQLSQATERIQIEANFGQMNLENVTELGERNVSSSNENFKRVSESPLNNQALIGKA